MPAIISGIAFNDLNSNGIFNVGEPGIANVFVVLVDTTGSCTSTQTDANGNYSFTNITTAGTYTLFETVTDPGTTCPPTIFTQPSGFTESTTPRQINRAVTLANISGDVNLSGNNFGHDNLASNGCTSFAYQVQGSPTTLTQIDLVTGGTSNLGTLNPSSTFGGTGYNVTDGNFWGYNTTTNTVSRITANRTVTNLPAIPNLPLVAYNVGDVDSDGYLYLYSSSTTNFFVVDVNPNRGTYGRLVDPANSFDEQTVAPFGVEIEVALFISDWAFNPQDGLLYGVNNTTGVTTRINPVTGAVTVLPTTGGASGTYGATFFDNNNNLYAIENTNGRVFRYAISGNTATRTFFSQSVAAATNDGARCATAPLAFAQLNTTKSATPNVGVSDVITYRIVFNNVGNQTANNVIFLDTIPNGTSYVGDSINLNGVTIPGDPTPPTGVNIGDLPIGVSTLTFNVIATTVPTPNPTPNEGAFGSFNFIDTGNTFTSNFNSNSASTTINFLSLVSIKTANKSFANIGDVITYTISYTNTGNTTANQLLFIDTIPNSTSFVTGSLRQDGVLVSGNPNPPGVTLPNSFGVGRTTTITFNVVVTTLPSPNPIENIASATGFYIGNPSIPTVYTTGSNSNQFDVLVSRASLDLVKSVDKEFATCKDILTYTIVVPNSGNTTAINIIIKDTIPNGTVFVANSVILNGTTQSGANPILGITIPDISPGAASTITFQVEVQC